MHFQFFIFAWPGHALKARDLESNLVARGEDVQVIASGIDDSPERWLKLSNDAYFGDQFVSALDRFDGDVLVHVQADGSITDLDYFLQRLRYAHTILRPGVWAPDVDYTFYRTDFVLAPTGDNVSVEEALDPSIVEVVNTDCTCWSLSSAVVQDLRGFVRPDWKLGWGWDTLAAATSSSLGLRVLRDLSVKVRHPRGTGYNTEQAAGEFDRVKATLSPEMRQLVRLQEALILERYRHSREWWKDQLRIRS